MKLRMFQGLVAACLVCTTLPSMAWGQSCTSGCGPRIANSCLARPAGCGPHGMKQYPLSEWRYIKQFCGPHITPESCFGYYKPQITRWTEACPNYAGPPDVDSPIYQPAARTAAPARPTETSPTPAQPANPAEKPTVTPPKVDLPKVDPPKVELPKSQPLTPPKLEDKKPVLPMIPRIDEVPGKPPTGLPPVPATPVPSTPVPVLPKIPNIDANQIPPAVQVPSEVPVTRGGGL